jgi:molecular chaperone HscB
MIDFSRDYFELFGLPQRFRFDPAALERAYLALQSEVHPDRHASAEAAERRVALQSSAHVNTAYRTLRDPVTRAHYLLTLHGIDALEETDTALPLDFLERQLERREAAEEAAESRDSRALEAIVADARVEARDLEDAVAQMLDERGGYTDARMPVRELKFLAKLTEDLDALQARFDEPVDG